MAKAKAKSKAKTIDLSKNPQFAEAIKKLNEYLAGELKK